MIAKFRSSIYNKITFYKLCSFLSLNKGKTMDNLKVTEQQNKDTINIDKNSIFDILTIINKEDSSVTLAIKEILPRLEQFIQDLLIRFNNGGRLFYIGSGTSGRLGVLDAAECPPTFRTNPNLIQGVIAGGYSALYQSIEGAEDDYDAGVQSIINSSITKDDTVLGISASSSTPFVLGALQEAKN